MVTIKIIALESSRQAATRPPALSGDAEPGSKIFVLVSKGFPAWVGALLSEYV